MGGVCSGVSVHLGIPVNRVRMAFLLGLPALGSSALLYLWLMLTLPLENPGEGAAGGSQRLRPRLSRNATGGYAQTVSTRFLLAGGLLLGVALVVAAGQWMWHWNWAVVIAVIFMILGLAIGWTVVPQRGQWRGPRFLLTITASVILLVGGLFLLVGTQLAGPALNVAAMAGAIIMVVLAAAAVPIVVRVNRDLSETQLRQARETERADIAAHLHDSVLQTLTLIRGAAEDPTRVRVLALTQERELRAWLYTGHPDPGTSTAALLREKVTAAESSHGVEISFVAVGDAAPGENEVAACLGGAEALTNALLHGEAPISVYLEVGPERVEVFVKDSGAGFDIDQIPADRHGLRDSIYGRVERVGGRAQVRTGPQTGTEVHLSVPRSGAVPPVNPNFSVPNGPYQGAVK